MPPPRFSFLHRAIRWLVPAAALALGPKCVLCVLAYAGVGGALLAQRELCGAPQDHRVVALAFAAPALAAGFSLLARYLFVRPRT